MIRAHVQSLALSHFRNYEQARIEVGPGSVVLVAPNGAGKTNLLEAISLLTPGRGLRRAALSDMDKINDRAPWAVAAEVHGPQGDTRIGTGRDPESEASDKRIVRIDGRPLRGQAELTRVFSALWLTPQMDTLFLEGGTARRKFLDRLVYTFDAEQATRVNAYEFAMRERNRLLALGRSEPAWLAALEQKMAEQGIAIAVARQYAVEGLMGAMQLSPHSFPKATVALEGLIETALAEGSALAAEERFRALLAENRGQDAASGRCQIGAHRTQMQVTHLEKNMTAERCSTGEQKALLVSIVLAQARAASAWHGRAPALLLDEVAAHLDSTRRGELFAELSALGAQAWLTGTDRSMFEGFEAQYFAVESGVISPA